MQPVKPAGTSYANTQEEVRAMRERAGQDLTDISALRKDEPFDRFFMRRIRQKRDQAILALITEKCDATTREGHRQKVLALEEVLTLLDDDDKAARSLLSGTA